MRQRQVTGCGEHDATAGSAPRVRDLAWLAGACLLSGLLLAAAGGYRPWITPDTPGYLDPPPLPAGWAQTRNPLFGWLVGLLPAADYAVWPALQTGLFWLAAATLHVGLLRYGLSRRAAWSVTASLLASNVLILWHAAIHPELLSAAAATASIAFLVRLAAPHGALGWAAAAGLAAGAAYLLRPTFLPLIFVLPCLFAILARLRSGAGVAARTALVLACCGLPFGLVSAARLSAVGDFNVVSFGGFQMSGLAGLLLTPEIAGRLPDDLKPLAAKIIAGREAAERAGEVLPTPVNSRGERSFPSAALGYYDIYARTYDALLYGVIAPLQGDEGWVAWNRRLMRLSIATVASAPASWLAWIVGGLSRSVGRLVVTNAPLMLTLAALAGLFPVAILSRRAPRPPDGPLDVRALVSITALYTLAAGSLMVVTTFPAARYLDTAALFLPALPIYAALGLIRSLRV